MQYRNMAEGVALMSQTLRNTAGARQLAAGTGRMSGTSAESVILAHKSRTNSVPGRKKASFPVTLQVFFHELIPNPRTPTLMSLQCDTFGGMWEKKRKKKKKKKITMRKGNVVRCSFKLQCSFDGGVVSERMLPKSVS